MASSVFDQLLVRHMWTTDELRAIFSDDNRVQKWYDFEAALALEQAALGIIPEAAAQEIAAKAQVENVDLEAIAAETRASSIRSSRPCARCRKLCKDDHGEYMHFGPTTQDVLDTGMVLQVKQAHAVLLRDLRAIGRSSTSLRRRTRPRPWPGARIGAGVAHHVRPQVRDLALRNARQHERMRRLEAHVFVGQMVGAVGTKASYGEHAMALEQRVMKRLGLGVADINWQPARDRLAEYVCVLGLIGGTLGKIANEIINLERNEIDELAEPFSEGKVGSSTMPHKRNPSVVETMVTVSRAMRYSVAMMHDACSSSTSATWPRCVSNGKRCPRRA